MGAYLQVLPAKSGFFDLPVLRVVVGHEATWEFVSSGSASSKSKFAYKSVRYGFIVLTDYPPHLSVTQETRIQNGTCSEEESD